MKLRAFLWLALVVRLVHAELGIHELGLHNPAKPSRDARAEAPAADKHEHSPHRSTRRPQMPTFDDDEPVAARWIANHTLLVTLLLVAAVYMAAKKLNDAPKGEISGGASDGGLARARAIQQERLERAAAGRPQDAASPSAAPGSADVLVPKKSDKPAPKSKLLAEEEPTSVPKATKSGARLSADDPKSYSARLARLEKGKGSDSNPLKGFGGGSGSSSGGASRRKRGGG